MDPINPTSSNGQLQPQDSRNDLVEYFFLFLRNWYWLALGLAIGLTIAWLHLRYSTNIYQVKGTVLINEKGQRSISEEMIVEDLGFAAKSNVEDDLQILKSSSLMRRVVDSLGINVTYHEFAHQLDQADSRADGVPPLDDGEDYSHWAGVWSDEYADFLDQVDAWESHRSQKAPLLDPYGAENPAEFFAVSTEGFFEFPHELQQERPALYAELKHYYGLDPARWVPKRS